MKPATLLATCLLGVTGSLHSAVLTHWIQDAPVANIFQSTIPTTPVPSGYAWSNPTQGLAQTFHITSPHELEAFIFQAGAFTAVNRPFSLKLYRTETLAANPLTTGTLLYSDSGTLPANTTGAPNTPRFISLNLSTPLVLAADYYYTVALQLTSEGSGIIGLSIGTGFSDAQRWSSTDSGATWSYNLNVFHLYLQGTAVPEPGSTALLLGTSLLLLPLLRRKFIS